MSSKEPVYKSQLNGFVDGFLQQKRRKSFELSGRGEGDTDCIDIIEFIERFKLLPFGLYPVQKFIVKLYYNIPLDDKEKTITIRNFLNNEIENTFTESEYLKYLYDNGRCNIREQDGKTRHELILVIGRRSGKSALSALFAAYEIYKLLNRGHPQAYYGMPPGSEIRILCVANDKDQASIVYGDVQAHVEAVDYFKSSVANSTQTFMRFRTENDRKKFGQNGKSTIVSSFKSSIAKGLRGRGVICSILDEIGFFVDTGRSSAEQIYRAINPALAQFSPKDKNNRHIPLGPSDGRMILISSPDAREGFFFKQYQLAMSKDKGSSDILVIQAPTWEVNPTLSTEYYEKEYFKDPKSFMTEHGAQFSDRVRGWIESYKDLRDCIDDRHKPVLKGSPKEVHFCGLDFGLSNDGTSIALTRFNAGKIELAYHEVWYPKISWKEANPHLDSPLVDYCLNLHNVQRLDIEEIAKWIVILSKRFFIHKGIFDQWAGTVFEQILHNRGLTQFEMRNFFTSDSSNMYQTFMMFMLNRQIRFYDYPRTEVDGKTTKHSPLIQELLELQATSAGKNLIVVEAPKVPGKHDDQSDAVARSILLASEYLRLNPKSLNETIMNTQTQSSMANMNYKIYQRMKMQYHGGVKPLSKGGRPR